MAAAGAVGGLLLLALPPAGGVVSQVNTDSAPLGTLVPTYQLNLDHFDLGVNHGIVQSSPSLAMIGGSQSSPTPAVVVGDRIGNVFGIDLATGRASNGTSRVLYANPQQNPIDSTPSSVVLGDNGNLASVYVGLGNRSTPCGTTSGPSPGPGGYLSLNADGSVKWFRLGVNPPSDPACTTPSVDSGIAIAHLNSPTGQFDATGMTLGEGQMAFNAKNGNPLGGWNPWFQADSSDSTPAIARLDGPSSANQVIEGGDSTQGLAYGWAYQNGGHVRIVDKGGNGGIPGAGGTRCSRDFYNNGGQIVQSSPAVGLFLGPNHDQAGIASGMGYFSSYGGASNRIVVMNASCQIVWSHTTDFETSSPILADVNGDGHLDVIVGTEASGTDAAGVYAYDGQTGALLWRTTTGSIIGAPVAANLRNTGHADVVVISTKTGPGGGLQIIDGKTGKVISDESQYAPQIWTAGQNSPLITADPNGTIGITVAGYKVDPVSPNPFGLATGWIDHYEIKGSHASWLSIPNTSWLQFHHDPQLTGNASQSGL